MMKNPLISGIRNGLTIDCWFGVIAKKYENITNIPPT
jgi:hypothetical protein